MTQPTNGNAFSQRAGIVLQTVVVVSLFVGGFWAGVIAPLNQRQHDMEGELKNYISKDEHAEFKLRIDKDITEVKEQILRLRPLIVPRSENEVRWTALDANLKLMSDRLNELRTTTTSTYTVRDEVQRLEKQLSELQSRMVAK
jgi:predicted  nucleic acid-binding Zn-ribbon protein